MKNTPIELEEFYKSEEYAEFLYELDKTLYKDLGRWSMLFKTIPIDLGLKNNQSTYILYIDDTRFSDDNCVLDYVPKQELIKKLSKYDAVIIHSGLQEQINRVLYQAYAGCFSGYKNVVIVKTFPKRNDAWMDFVDFDLRNKQGERLRRDIYID